MPKNKLVVVEVRGGVVVEIYTDMPVEIVVVDWDRQDDNEFAFGWRPVPIKQMPTDTRIEVNKAE